MRATGPFVDLFQDLFPHLRCYTMQDWTSVGSLVEDHVIQDKPFCPLLDTLYFLRVGQKGPNYQICLNDVHLGRTLIRPHDLVESIFL